MYQRSPTVQERKIAREFVTRIAGYIDEPEPAAKGRKPVAAKPVATKAPAAPEVKLDTAVRGGKIVNVGEVVSRKVPSNPWVMLAQSMICSNEFVYLN